MAGLEERGRPDDPAVRRGEGGDLAADWAGQRRALFARLGVEDAVTASTFRADKLAHRDDQFDAGTRAYVERELGEIIPAMGYE